MNAEIIAVGSELLTPSRIDTDSLWLTGQLNQLGVELVGKQVIGDDRARLAAAIEGALSRAALVILTGGLGPTEDDVTRDAVAAATGRPLLFRQDVCDGIEARFRRMNRAMVEINRRQAYIIEGSEVLGNPNGTAPGLWLEHNGAVIALLPGPPREMKPMFIDHCLPRLKARIPPLALRTRWYRVAGMGESDVDQLIAPVYTRYSNPATTILAKPGDIEIHLRARCETADEAERLLAEVGEPIEALLGDRIYSRNGDPLEAVIGAVLRKRGETLAVAESCTGGGLAERITAIAGASDYFAGGFLTYTWATKTRLLGVDPILLRQHGAVSEPVALAMTAGARERAGTTWAISVTGVAGPSQGGEKVPVGTIFIGIAGPGVEKVREVRFIGDRARIRALAIQTALDLLRKTLSEQV